MIKKISNMRSVIFIILVIELLLITTLSIIIPSDIMVTLAVYVVIKNIVILIAFLLVFMAFDNNLLSVGEIVSSDAETAYIFGGIGLINYDEHRNVTWTSDLFVELGITIIGEKLLEWQPQLASLFEDEEIKMIDINSRKYEVYNNTTTRMLYIKDITDYYTLSKDYEDQQNCMAYISIDNYDESIDRADEQTVAAIQTVTRQTLLNWAENNGIVLKRYRSDSFLAIFSERIYHKQVEQKFNILDFFKEEVEKLGVVMTLSVGIARESKILRELDEMAFNALGMSYSRGGDQVVVKSLSEDIRYFGGNTESKENVNRVRSRIIGQSLGNLIKQSSNVLIMGHRQSDFDSLGASIAVHSICRAYGIDSHIILDSESLEEKTANIVTELKNDILYRDIIISPQIIKDYIAKDTLLIVVDHHKPSLSIDTTVLSLVSNVVVIDHHRRGQEFIDLPILTYLESNASSTVELVVELFEYQKTDIKLSEREATIMYTGMLIDTNNFKSRVSPRTFEVAANLRKMQANVFEANRYIEDDLSTTQDKYAISRNAYLYGDGILIAYGESEKRYDRTLLAKVANELLSIGSIKGVFVVGNTSKNEVAISARSSRDINVQVIMEKLGGGGHFSMSACQLKDSSLMEGIQRLETAINEYLDERVSE